MDILARVPHRQPYMSDISTSIGSEGLTRYRMPFMMVVTEQGHIVMASTTTDMLIAESPICCYELTSKPEGLLETARGKFRREVQAWNCRVVIIQVDSSHGSVLAETLYNGVGVAEDEAQNNSTTPRSARGPPNAIPAQQSNVSYAS